MIWDLEECVEDAISAYLRQNVPGTMKVYEAGNFTTMEFPCVIVMCGPTQPVSETANWHDARQMTVSVVVKSEWAHEIDGSQNTIRTAREVHAAAKGAVMSALARVDLAERIAATQPPRVLFTMAQVNNTDVDIQDRVRSTAIIVDVIASPAEAA